MGPRQGTESGFRLNPDKEYAIVYLKESLRRIHDPPYHHGGNFYGVAVRIIHFELLSREFRTRREIWRRTVKGFDQCRPLVEAVPTYRPKNVST